MKPVVTETRVDKLFDFKDKVTLMSAKLLPKATADREPRWFFSMCSRKAALT